MLADSNSPEAGRRPLFPFAPAFSGSGHSPPPASKGNEYIYFAGRRDASTATIRRLLRDQPCWLPAISDAARNLTGDGTYTYQWDGDARLKAVLDGLLRTVSASTCNALGQRVRDVTLTTSTDEAYGAGGELLWRYTGNSNDPNQRAFVPFQGRILADYYSGGTLFDHRDELGSLSTASNHTGNSFAERLFYPFGELSTGGT
jgi:hypothetical protein